MQASSTIWTPVDKMPIIAIAICKAHLVMMMMMIIPIDDIAAIQVPSHAITVTSVM